MENTEKQLDIVTVVLSKTGTVSMKNEPVYGVENSFYGFLDNIYNRTSECLIALFMKSNNIPEAISLISVGNDKKIICNTQDIFRIALLTNCSKVMIGHNHPNDSLEPSESDLILTKNIIDFGKMIGLEIVDSLIVIPQKKVYSIKQKITLQFN